MTGEFLWPRWLERELAEIHESWRPLREAVARDWDRLLGTGPTPVAFRLAEQATKRMAGPTAAEQAAALVPLIRQAAAETERPTFRVNDQPGYHAFSTRNERWIDHVPPPPPGLRHADSTSQVVDWAQIVAYYWQMGVDVGTCPVPPEPSAVRRPHGDGLGCWCNPFADGAQVIHLDDAVPPGHGWAFQQTQEPGE